MANGTLHVALHAEVDLLVVDSHVDQLFAGRFQHAFRATQHRNGIGRITLAALEQLTALSASLCVGLAALDHDADGEALWAAANLEEDWQIEQWGADEEAAARRAKRLEAFLKAMAFVRLAQN